MSSDEGFRIVDISPDEPGFRAFFQVAPQTETVETHNVWRVGLALLGRPPTDIALRVLFHGEPDAADAITLGFKIDQVRQLHQALGNLLCRLDAET